MPMVMLPTETALASMALLALQLRRIHSQTTMHPRLAESTATQKISQCHLALNGRLQFTPQDQMYKIQALRLQASRLGLQARPLPLQEATHQPPWTEAETADLQKKYNTNGPEEELKWKVRVDGTGFQASATAHLSGFRHFFFTLFYDTTNVTSL